MQPSALSLFWLSLLTQRLWREIAQPLIALSSESSPAFRGLGTPPTKTVFLGSSGSEASRTKSASESRQGRICTGLSLMVGEETHRYSLSSSWMHASISDCTDSSFCSIVGFYQLTYFRLFRAISHLKQEEGVPLGREVRLTLRLVGPVDDERAEPPETRSYFIW